MEGRGRYASALAVVTTLSVLAASGPALASGARLGQFVGQAGKSAIGASLGAGGSLAYVCDGKRVGTWFKGGALEGRKLVLRAADSSRLKLTVDGKDLEARLGAETTSLRPATGKAGLYRSENEQGSKTKLAGWVVQRSGKQLGTLQTGTQLSAAPKLSTTTLLAGPLVAAPVTEPSDVQPLVIDLGGDGIDVSGTATTTALGAGAQAVRWTVAGDDDAFIGVDAAALASRGFVLSSSGLLVVRGGLSVTRNGVTTTATDGFHLLRLLDSDRDGSISPADPAYIALRLFHDSNGDGDFADSGDSIFTLAEEATSALNTQAVMDRLLRHFTLLSAATRFSHQLVMNAIRSTFPAGR
ncbi:MAG: hypothetical protein ACHQJ5_01940 [Vicinamibacteria bacterium]